MQRVLLDLKEDDGREAFLTLAASADVVVESFRPGVMDRLGVGYDAVAARHPGIIYCSTSGYGQHGPYSQRAGHDINYLATGGFLAMSTPGVEGRPPLPGATVADAAAGGMQAALAICAALAGRAASGTGAYLDVAVADGVLWLMSLAIDEDLALQNAPGPGHDVLSGRYACYGTYQAKDGRWLAVGAIESKFFANLCRALGCADLAGAQFDDAGQPQLRAALADAFATKDRDEWIDLLADADTCVGPVYAVSEVADDAQFAARGVVATATHPQRGAVRQLAPLLAGMVRGAGVVSLPDTGQTQTAELLHEAGVDDGTIRTWITRRAVA
jgi:alpha-methylacyl-CoA racemase